MFSKELTHAGHTRTFSVDALFSWLGASGC